MTDPSGPPVEALLQTALHGDRQALGTLLERHRAYLKLLAQRYLDGRIEPRIDESDLAQQTCLSAVRDFQRFRGQTVPAFIVWLRRIHERNVQNALRGNLATAKRSADREERIGDVDGLATQTASPSQRAMQGESAVQLAQALEQLPPEQREAVRLRYLEGLPMEQIARQLGKTRDTVVGLVKRGILNLRKHLQ